MRVCWERRVCRLPARAKTNGARLGTEASRINDPPAEVGGGKTATILAERPARRGQLLAKELSRAAERQNATAMKRGRKEGDGYGCSTICRS